MSNARTLASTINSSSQIVVPSGGINFSDIQTAYSGTTSEILDGYEEGTFEPTVSTGTASYLYAHYTKIGRLVNCGGVISSFSDRTSTNNIEFALPFNSRSGARFKGTVVVRYLNNTANTTVTEITDSSSVGKLVVGDTGNYGTLKHSDLNNVSSQIQFEICYETT